MCTTYEYLYARSPLVTALARPPSLSQHTGPLLDSSEPDSSEPAPSTEIEHESIRGFSPILPDLPTVIHHVKSKTAVPPTCCPSLPTLLQFHTFYRGY